MSRAWMWNDGPVAKSAAMLRLGERPGHMARLDSVTVVPYTGRFSWRALAIAEQHFR